MKRITLAIVAALAASACNTYQFVPVEPCGYAASGTPITVKAKPGKPNLFLLVDKSGSMKFTTSEDPACSSCISSPCTLAGCATRWSDLTSAMHQFLPTAGADLHLGMVPFPVADSTQAALQCTGPQVSDIATLGVPLDTSADSDVAGMQQTATAVQNRIDAIDPYGGTPTAASVTMLGGYTLLTQPGDHPSFALLLTDGVPNCDDALDANTCTCTQATTPCSASVGGATLNLCLDDSGTAAALAALAAQGVRTIVVGFGNEALSPLGGTVLQQLGAAGGFNRPCATDGDCGAGDSCSVSATDACGRPTLACARSYYTAHDGMTLANTLGTIRDSLSCQECTFALTDPPADSRYLAVEFNGDSLPPGQPDTWSYDAATKSVTFSGAACAQLKASTATNPVNLEFRTVQPIVPGQANCQL